MGALYYDIWCVCLWYLVMKPRPPVKLKVVATPVKVFLKDSLNIHIGYGNSVEVVAEDATEFQDLFLRSTIRTIGRNDGEYMFVGVRDQD